MPVPSREPDYELIIPDSGTGLTEVEFTGGYTMPSTVGAVDVGEDDHGRYLTIASGSGATASFQRDDYDEFPDADQVTVEVECEIGDEGDPAGNSTFAFFVVGLRPRFTFIDNTIDDPSHPFRYSVFGRPTLLPPLATGYRHWWVQSRLDAIEVQIDDPYISTGDGYHISSADPWDSIDATSPWFMQLDHGLGEHQVRLYAARVWIGGDVPSGSAGMWGLRQRQALPGNAGGWPLRQRQNGGATGTWPLRQRQTGI